MGKSFENERLSYFDVFHGNKTGDGTKHDPEKDVLVADQFLDIAGDHAGEHHAEGHEAGADGVMSGLLRTFAEEHHEVGEGRETEPVTELFDGDGGGD